MKIFTQLSLILLLSGIISSCSTDLTVDFTVNDKSFKDTIEVNLNDTIMIKDISSPSGDIDSRVWKFAERTISKKNKNMKDFKIPMSNEGIFEVKLCANSSASCISKWINVVDQDNINGVVLNPTAEFVNPMVQYSTVTERSYSLEIQTDNVLSKSDIELLIDGESKGFSFDEEDGLVIKNLILNEGDNMIELKITNGDITSSDWVSIEYEKESTKPKKTTASKKKSKKTIEDTFGNASTRNRTKSNNSTKSSSSKVKNNSTSTKSNTASTKSNKPKTSSSSVKSNSTKSSTAQAGSASSRSDNNTSSTNSDTKSSTTSSTVDNSKSKLVDDAKKNTVDEPVDITVIRRSDSNEKTDVDLEHVAKKKDEAVEIVRIENNPDAKIDNSRLRLYSKSAVSLNISDYDRACSKAIEVPYTFYVTPSQVVELLELTVYTDNCGGLEIQLVSNKVTETMIASLVKGKNQITLFDLYPTLKANVKYKIICTPIAGYSNCQSGNAPRLLDASSCTYKAQPSGEIDVDYLGKSIIYNLEYRY